MSHERRRILFCHGLHPRPCHDHMHCARHDSPRNPTMFTVGRKGRYVFGFIQDDAATYVAVSDGVSVTLTTATPMGSGLTGFYGQLPDSWVSPEPYTLTACDQGTSIGSATR